jgi:uncharacterized protein YkwD
MLSSLTLTLSFLALLTTSEDAAPATAKKTSPAATSKAFDAKKDSPAAAKAGPSATDSAAKDKKEAEKKKAAKKKDQDLELHPIEVSVVSLTNEQRKKYSLPELEVDKKLMYSARKHCGWMTRNRIFQHGNWGVAENIAMGQRDSRQVVRAWMNSSGHRANILNPRHRRIGVSAYRTKTGTIYWCQQFRN